MAPTLTKEFKIGKTIFDFSKPYIMGILNVTPDSFSDGGQFLNEHDALVQIEKMIEEGADIIDIGAQSTRPFVNPVDATEEMARLKPVLTQYHQNFQVPLSLDTTQSTVAKFGLDLGVNMINDISGLHSDPKIAELVSNYHQTIILMHSQGTPQTMQVSPSYQDVIQEIKQELSASIQIAKNANIDQIIIDPGIGFGKTVAHNLTILKNLRQFTDLGYPILVGTSRKSFLGQITESPVTDRLAETISSCVVSVLNGAQFVRVHDVSQVKKALKIVKSIEDSL